MSLHGAEVVVAGGGIGGTATALLLARIGARVTLLERREAGGDPGAGLLLHPNGLAVLVGLGLGPAVAAAGRVLTGSSLRTAAGIRLLDRRAWVSAPASARDDDTPDADQQRSQLAGLSTERTRHEPARS